jgi:signal transduction histidine kinase
MEALKLLHAAIPTTIEIRENIAPDTSVVNADPTQVHQVLMNLCTNAEQAMPEGGAMEISLTNVELDEKFCAKHEGLTPGSFVGLTVMDTGSGMDQETLERIFDPFFTTKDPGKGTGMGLSVVHGIVKSHEGDITVHSEPGMGTTFHVYLPVVESIAERRIQAVEPVRGGN